jgi:uncharacterized RDD family membrane protein YckC
MRDGDGVEEEVVAMTTVSAPPKPEPVPEPAPRPATGSGGEDLLGLRIAAALIDLAILLVLSVVLGVTMGEASMKGAKFSYSLGGDALAVFLGLAFLYYFGLEATIGRTVGKLLLGLKVISEDGDRADVVAVAVRTVLRVVDWLPLMYLTGFVAAMATGIRRQRLGDLVAETVVVRALPVRRRGLAAAAAAVVGLVLLGLSVSLSTSDDDVSGPKLQPPASQKVLAVSEGETLLQDDFSDPTSGWDAAEFHEGEIGYVEGAYRIFAKRPNVQIRSNIGGSEVQGLRLEFEATQLAGTSGDLVGARCYTDLGSDAGYIVGIGPAEQGVFISAFRGDDYRLLESSGERVKAVRPLGEENQLRVECVASPDAPIVLTLEVNGEALARAEDEERTRGFDGFGLFVDTREGGAHALFDDIVATELVPE